MRILLCTWWRLFILSAYSPFRRTNGYRPEHCCRGNSTMGSIARQGRGRGGEGCMDEWGIAGNFQPTLLVLSICRWKLVRITIECNPSQYTVKRPERWICKEFCSTPSHSPYFLHSLSVSYPSRSFANERLLRRLWGDHSLMLLLLGVFHLINLHIWPLQLFGSN